MVLTVPVHNGDERRGYDRRREGYTRRTVLRATAGGVAAVVALSGCDGTQREGRPPVAPDPLNPFYRDTAALLARYEATLTAQPALADRLGPLRDTHRAHLEALAREIGPGLDTPPASSNAAADSPTDPAGALAALHRAEKDAAAAARTACLSAPSYRAVLLGCIAAARASHVEVLS
ncbi:hypothetical protein ACNTMW_07530 [Planosporangium sp. 12N6]|uniref:hypothetical protein n=1 Tax=Planosporangium spinosum TaxID=3402278 RepID=UPI003CF0EB11